MTRGQVAASVRRNKSRRPGDYCADARCLWNVARSGPCPKHAPMARGVWVAEGRRS